MAINGPLRSPRVRLYTSTDMSESDKLSWLVLGRASEGLGRSDTALLQRAAVALLAGDGEAPTDTLRNLGLDQLSVRQSDTDVRQTVISLGKQLSRRWYVGYERGVNSTTGTWQLIYRIAQRFTLRAVRAGELARPDLGLAPARRPAAAHAQVSARAKIRRLSAAVVHGEDFHR
ncbi:MAG: translocation/assembly module TamB domain-containing protein [Rubrivivax sp.]|nr:translocation/assembly module TamB domain-containing protein [Rubrivivax sp.]